MNSGNNLHTASTFHLPGTLLIPIQVFPAHITFIATPFYGWGNRGTERLNSLLKLWKLVRSGVGIALGLSGSESRSQHSCCASDCVPPRHLPGRGLCIYAPSAPGILAGPQVVLVRECVMNEGAGRPVDMGLHPGHPRTLRLEAQRCGSPSPRLCAPPNHPVVQTAPREGPDP